ncbi:MAG TPA: site-specific DNA-methyltransferase [Ktedonobacteraceae bacterium]
MEQIFDHAHTLYCADNLPILRSQLATASVDLIYLDPPFYSQRTYQAFLRQTASRPGGSARTPAFADTWRWEAASEQAYAAMQSEAPSPVVRALATLRTLLGSGSLLAYLVMMAQRLVEFHRVLKPSGSLYLHCDPAAGHYLKILLDSVFGAANFRNEIVWFYKTGGASPRRFARKHDLIFFYTRGEHYLFHPLKEKSYMMHRYGFKKSEFLRDERGQYTWVYMKDVWELPALGAADGQRLGYPTQKPEALLERIIQASSSEGDVVLDPFCGSGTTLAVAQRLGRRWIGIEDNYLGIAYLRYRLARTFPDQPYTFRGGPSTLAEARQLAETSPADFRWWALSLLAARPVGPQSGGAAGACPGLAHGILPGPQGPSLVVVAPQDGIELSTLARLRTLVESGQSTAALILLLHAPGPQQLAEAARAPAGALRLIPLADLLPACS